MNVPYGTTAPEVDVDLLAEFNAGTRRAIAANDGRLARERYLDGIVRRDSL